MVPSTPSGGPKHRDGEPATEAGLLLLAMIWGLNFPIIKVALQELPPMAFNALRFPLAALVLFTIFRFRHGLSWPERGDVPRLIALGILGNVVYQFLFIYGLDRTRAGNASLLLATTPVWTTLLSSLAGHERIRPLAWAGLAGTVLGMVLVVVGGSGPLSLGNETLVGDLMIAVASVTWSVYTVSGRNLIHKYHSLPVTAWTLWVGTACLVLLGIPGLRETDLTGVSGQGWAAVAYAGILGLGVAYMLWNRGVRKLGNARTAVYSNLVPVFALAAAWAMLGERPAALQILGALVILMGVSVTRIRPSGTIRPGDPSPDGAGA